MKKLILNYSFDASAKTITFLDYDAIELRRVLLISNATANVIIYGIGNPNKGGSVEDNVLTLTYDTNAAEMEDTDTLLIYYLDDNQREEVTVADHYKARKFIGYRFSAVTAGTIVGVQGPTLLGGIDISVAGNAVSLLKIYDSYYTTSNLKHNFDGAAICNKEFPGDGEVLTSGCFLVITGTSSPDITIYTRPKI